MDAHTQPLQLPIAGEPLPPGCGSSMPSPRPDGSRTLLDSYGRTAKDLRVSLTDRCNLRCSYCMPPEGLEWIPTDDTLSDEETVRLIRLAVTKLGVVSVRFTGGEPLLRRSLEDIIAATASLKTQSGAPVGVALTTNGLGLDKRAEGLKVAGLKRINISLDSLDPARYAALSRRNRLADVLAGIDASMACGLSPIKINTVVLPGVNEEDVLPLAHFCLERGLQLRFIEHMPIGPRGQWKREDLVTADQILDLLRAEVDLAPSSSPRGSAPAALWRARIGQHEGEIGVIASVTHPFCGDCDRTRLTADGAVRNCLFAHHEVSLRDLIRAGATDEELAEAWAGEMWMKAAGHGINDPGFLQPSRTMSAIGG